MRIIRRHGDTYLTERVGDDLSHAIGTWDWLLPRNGEFTTAELVQAIERTYDTGNPRTACDLRNLRKF